MTFIATVRARNGLAVIADSLVSTIKPILELEAFLKFIEQDKSKDTTIPITFDEIATLFESKTHHTNDFEDKLVEYDQFTAITTAGNAKIDGNRISDIIKAKIALNSKNQSYANMPIAAKISDFAKYVNSLLRKEKQKRDTSTVFIISHFDTASSKSIIYEVKCQCARQENGKFKVSSTENLVSDGMKVILNGQNSIAYRVLYGNALSFGSFVTKLFESFRTELSLSIPDDEFDKAVLSITGNLYNKIPDLLDEISAFKIQELSIQQAVDLAYLLLKVEMDFQKYTEDIPTIGGVIKIATITQNGFKFLCGQDIEKPL